MGPDLFFGKVDEGIKERRAREIRAKAVCQQCDVIRECWKAGKDEEGIWGGVTDAQRRRTDARRPMLELHTEPSIPRALADDGWRLLEEHYGVRLMQRESEASWHGFEWVVMQNNNTMYHTDSLESAYLAFGKMVDSSRPR